jgi:hypothetical protein
MAENRLAQPLARSLAVITQLHLPGTAGRLSQQIRDLERVSPLFNAAGLVRKVQRPSPLTTEVAGIATATPSPHRVMGGFLYAAGAVRLDLIVKDNQVSTGAQDSACEIDDIDAEDQKERLKLISIRQAYELADAAMNDGERRDLIILDTPLLLSRSMVAPRDTISHRGHRQAYEATVETVRRFWTAHKERMFPWSKQGPVLVSVGGGRFGAVLQLAQQDLRTAEGREFVLPGENISTSGFESADGMEQAILTIGERRFLQGILGPFTRTAAFLLNVQSPSMEPTELANEGVVGFHYKGAQGTAARFAHMLGSPDQWSASDLDRVAGLLMAMSAIGGERAEPLPIMLANRELTPLEPFLESYAREVSHHMRNRTLEQEWLGGLDELD